MASFQHCAAHFKEEAAKNCGGHGCDVVFVGDSILEYITGHACYASRKYSDMTPEKIMPPSWHVHILAGSGDQTQHTLGHLGRCLPAFRNPKLFVVMIGTNNLGPAGRFTANDTLTGIKAVVQAIHRAHPAAQVLVHALLPRSDQPLQDAIDEVNSRLQAWRAPATRFVDCTAAFPKGMQNATAMEKVMPDLLHPNELGYKLWFRCLLPVIARKLGLSPTAVA